MLYHHVLCDESPLLAMPDSARPGLFHTILKYTR